MHAASSRHQQWECKVVTMGIERVTRFVALGTCRMIRRKPPQNLFQERRMAQRAIEEIKIAQCFARRFSLARHADYRQRFQAHSPTIDER